MKDVFFLVSGFIFSLASFYSARYALEGNKHKWLCRCLTAVWVSMGFVLFPLFLALGLYGPALIFVAANVILVWAGREHKKELARKNKTSTAVTAHVPLVEVDMPWLSLKEIGFSYFDYEGKVAYRRVDVESCDGMFIKGYCHFHREMRAFELVRIESGIIILRNTGKTIDVNSWLVAYVEAYDR
ncbi:hypothetical protein [Pantoea ananatis]|uniref:hypothetical protein n=1 Tax=Pantoea ananas TaxID=553 RepID=UPI001B300C0C|nr:hypothetical protein [Pantoea ananatis]